MNLSDQIYDFRRGIGDMGYAEILVVGYLNKAKRELAKHIQVVTQFNDKRSWSAIAHQAEYTMPARYAQRSGFVRYDNDPLVYKHKELIEQFGDSYRHSEATPTYFSLYSGKLELWAVPDVAADATTLNGAISKTAATITLTSVDGLKTKGRAIIDNEVISWEYVDTTTLQLSGVLRGLEGTIAATHSSGATFTERNIEWYGALLPKKYFARPSRSANLSAGVGTMTVGAHTVYIAFYSKKWASESLLTEVDSITLTYLQKIDVADIPVSDDADISHVRIYMTEAGGTDKYYVDEVENGTTTYSIDITDAQLIANSAYAIATSDVPEQFRDVEQEFAIGKWFWDNEQFIRAGQRMGKGNAIIQEWVESLVIETGGGYDGLEY